MPSALYIFWILHQTTTQPPYWKDLFVVYLLNPTSNHNVSDALVHIDELYIFWILHQTTTPLMGGRCLQGCISFESYIKPQHLRHPLRTGGSCISFESYIKPQLYLNYFFFHVVVYLLNPTSNHNFALVGECPLTLYIFWILHQTTTQLNAKDLKNQLYIFWILHQTTTYTESSYYNSVLYIFWILHQTTTGLPYIGINHCCISFESYIKPQH